MNCLAAMPIVLAVALAGQPDAPPARPSLGNPALLAIMPGTVESVMLVRFEAPIDYGGVIAGWRDSLGHFGDEELGRDDLLNTTLRAVAAAHPSAFLWAGSGFTGPDGIGVGNFDERWIWVVGSPVTALRERLDACEGVAELNEPFDVQGVRVYSAKTFHYPDGYPHATKEKIEKETLVAFPREHVVLIAQSRRDIEHMVSAALKPPDSPPVRWAPVAEGLDLGSPLLILREYDPRNTRDWQSPLNATREDEDGQADIRMAGLALPDDAGFRLNVVSRTPDRAKRFYRTHVLVEDAFAWKDTPTETGFRAVLRVAEGAEDGAPLLCLLVFFGPNIGI